MKPTLFFKPTPLHKEFLLLTLIQRNASVTQRDLARTLDISVAMVNNYLDEYEKAGYIKRVYASSKTVKYIVTDAGESRRKLLNIQYLESALDVYNDAKMDCYKFFNNIISRGFRNIVFYGAGEVAEIMLTVINNDEDINLNVLAIIDDDLIKQGKTINNKQVISFDKLSSLEYDGILISTYINSCKIYNKLIKLGLKQEKLLQFFEN